MRARSQSGREPRVFMLDLWATVPYYTAYLSRALQGIGIPVQIGSITYYLDKKCFTSRGLRLDPGCSDLVGGRNLSRTARRLLKLAEGVLNLVALSIRFCLRPPDVVHIQFLTLLRSKLPLDLWFVRLCRWRGSRSVLTVHDLLPHDTGLEHREVFRRLYSEMDALICHSEHIRSRLETEFAVPAAKISVIPHGPFFYDLPSGEELATAPQAFRTGRTVLWQGIIFPYKGVDLLLEAWKQVEQQSQDAALVVLGTGDPALTAKLEEQARQLELSRIRFDFRYCSTQELVAAYRAADVVVYPYRAITTSGALATGLALEKVIVASDLPVFRELLVDDVSALLVDPLNSAALAGALLRALHDDDLRERLSNAVRALQFGEQSWIGIAEQTATVYRDVLERPA